MIAQCSAHRVFLFLQGPHGPFFHQLGRMLQRTGAQVWRVGFNAGDSAFWPDRNSYIPYRGPAQDWEQTFAGLAAAHHATDLVLYGDTRPIHARAIARARRAGLRIHVFEEGYLRPYWVTYERGGSNGHSRLMELGLPEMRKMLALSDLDAPLPPARWGDLRQHVFYGALYHALLIAANHRYRAFRPHRAIPAGAEFRLYLRRLLRMPLSALERRRASARIRRGGFPYHVALLQLEHDASFRAHSPFATLPEFIDRVMQGFAEGAPGHHHLVLKAHPLEDGRVPLRREIARLTRLHGLRGRVHYVRGGKLGALLDDCRSAVTVNSTAAQQVLYRGIPLKTFGTAVYDKPEFVSAQPLPAFFAGAARPDGRAYRDYRRFLLETSQVAGGFYSARGRRQLLRQVVDMMLAEDDPYDALRSGTAAPRQKLHAVP
ncbi:capsule biosynthesis protein CapA [Pseudooceanicola sp. CBS1P-1]|uniref:Capsule biosynthesis protein CapA n=1 Tax=Pseudooceanicola albus TaxID=2692189 RepID=A0A6L7FWH7_9RHOB|nr:MULTISPECIES: capsule biosynthesis protein CapA [Pseudooceanicola]MBT9383457.1 capsule biosynthesis protein CapA [Pseudooceanicola endophyticus]MXN16221.1 capsule biosynthesis protein CapA [Pseudooceanicola albus]